MVKLPDHLVPGTRSYNLQDGRHLIVGRAVDIAVRIRQLVVGPHVSVFDQRQSPLLSSERMRGGKLLKNIGECLTVEREGLTWVITHVAMRSVNPSGISLGLRHRGQDHSYSMPWLHDGVQVVTPIDVTAKDPLAIWSSQTTDATIVLRGIMVWSPEAVAAEAEEGDGK